MIGPLNCFRLYYKETRKKVENRQQDKKNFKRHCQAVIQSLLLWYYVDSLQYFPWWISRAFFPSFQCALAADEVVFNQKELEVNELKNQVQMMVQENKGHVMSLKEAQKVNRLQVEFLNISSSVGLVRIVPS